ncbi:hypothetical protein HK104_004669 [Borealophlyctis nickersoniae]|nr:hypothetical protein HK104_004669 [Borealophlyctis nickersoniae]
MVRAYLPLFEQDTAAVPSPAPFALADTDRLDGGEKNPGAKALLMSFMVIIVSEIGDKTFFIAAVMAMKSPRLLIFSAAMASLLVMTLLSAFMGHVVPNLISKQYTQILVSGLFLVFGLKMVKDAYGMTGKEGQEELDEVVQELEEKEQAVKADDMETGEVGDGEDEKDELAKRKRHASVKVGRGPLEGFTNLASYLFSPVWTQAFVLTFLGEWGDRSQIATVALAGAEDFWWVTLGSLAGHALCTSIAVIGGRLLAQKISVKTVTLIGGALFLIFGFASFYQAIGFYDQ